MSAKPSKCMAFITIDHKLNMLCTFAIVFFFLLQREVVFKLNSAYVFFFFYCVLARLASLFEILNFRLDCCVHLGMTPEKE